MKPSLPTKFKYKRRSVGCSSVIESERLFPRETFQDTTPGPCAYIIPSTLISGKAKRFGKPQVIDIFNIKQKEYIPGPDAYFIGENEKFHSSLNNSEGFTFTRAPKILFNEVKTSTQKVEYVENPFREEKNKTISEGFSQLSPSRGHKDEKLELIGPGYYTPNDSFLTTTPRTYSCRFGQKNVNTIGFSERRRSTANTHNYQKLVMKMYNIRRDQAQSRLLRSLKERGGTRTQTAASATKVISIHNSIGISKI